MNDSLIAIIGSAQADRQYKPPLENPEGAKQAAVELGRELAKQGFRILVYSSDPRFIEADFVQGFASVAEVKPKSIQIRYPIKNNTQFKEQATQPQLFDVRPETGDWEVSFYRSLQEIDGVILIGGGTPTLIAGLFAIKNGTPLLPLAAFGAKARSVWDLATSENLLVTPAEIAQMADWQPQSSAEAWVKILSNQQQARLQVEEKKQRREKAQSQTAQGYALFSVASFAAAVAIAWAGLSGMVTAYSTLLGLLFFCPLLAGSSGAAIRAAFEWTQATPTKENRTILSTAALGWVIGGFAGLLFIVAQMTTLPQVQGQDAVIAAITQTQTQRLIPFALVIGFIGGLTLDAVVRKLTSIDVVDTKALGVLSTSASKKPETASGNP
jgi:hypothetical protein